ncbi:hypothetical protein HYH02_011986 [Chlamydomonas schloesseri]|uniref:Post-GPI attachment to proteins factor 3 n=1 Tax=Chlamydomonas schloesseri TaxID=2026947 RepID=A0A835T0U3_9CHLO|nr:hypothetical protein HYH02_011986 [Chlamydomonas schloesseri]|eukprot:KAG2434987.1 hypothetical protein HYH02_011986 [Chlamydomonas schloesseri]
MSCWTGVSPLASTRQRSSVGVGVGAILAALLLSFQPCCRGSSGDRSWVFQSCLQQCIASGCTLLPHLPVSEQQALGVHSCPAACARMRQASPMPLSLRLFRWSCEDDCKYHCMEAVEGWKARAAGGGLSSIHASSQHNQPQGQPQVLPVEKYYGKWPFRRVAGMQELLSVLASLANLAAHALCLARLRARVRTVVAAAHITTAPAAPPTRASGAGPQGPDGLLCRLPYPFLGLWTAYSVLHMNAWLWSALFHCRDTRTTERLDYCSAIAVVAAGLAAAVARSLWGHTRRRRLAAVAAMLCIIVGLAAHLHYMLAVKFDYGWNMRVCVAAGVTTALLWLVWVWGVRHPARGRMTAFLLLAHAAMLLEVLDFAPPVASGRLLDAHAAWHWATVPLTALFYSWLEADADWCQAGRAAVAVGAGEAGARAGGAVGAAAGGVEAGKHKAV